MNTSAKSRTRKKIKHQTNPRILFVLQIRDACKDLILTDEQLRLVMERLRHEIDRGLCKETHEEAIVRCYTTYVQDLPNGTG